MERMQVKWRGQGTLHGVSEGFWKRIKRPAIALSVLLLMLLAFLAIPTYSLLSATWSGQVTGHVASAAISGEFTGSIATYNLGTVAPGDSGTIPLVITNTGEVTLSIAQPTAVGVPSYLTVTFSKAPPGPPKFPAEIDPGESVTINVNWDFDSGYSGPAGIDFSLTVNVVATQVP